MNRTQLDPGRPRRGRAFHEKNSPGGAVRITLHHHRAVLQVRQQQRGHVGVILNQIALGDFEFRPEKLIQVGEPYFPAGNLEFNLFDVLWESRSGGAWSLPDQYARVCLAG